MRDHGLAELAELIKSKSEASADSSYTRQLLDAGVERCAKKFGEEAVELVIASVGADVSAIKAEAADVLYHLLVLLQSRGVAVSDVMAVLEARRARSGLEEKASRAKAAPS